MTLFGSHHKVWSAILMALVVVSVFSWLQSTPILADPDSFYHTKITLMNRDFGISQTFPWTQNSLYRDVFIDHHFLYHILLTPFVSFGDPLIGLKIATVIFASFSIGVIIFLLKKEKAPWLWLWLVLLLTNSPLIFRLSLGKAPSLAIGVTFIAWYLIIKRKHLALFFWSWLFVWFYSVWPVIIIMLVVTIAVESVMDGYDKIKYSGSTLPEFYKIIWKNIWSRKNTLLWLAGLSGIVAGIIINPYFPTNLVYLKQLFTMSVISYHKFVAIGAEWYPWPITELIEKISIPLLTWLMATIVFFLNIKKISKESFASWLMTIVFLIYTIKARRQAEYLVPWFIISSGLILRDGLADFSIKSWWKNIDTWLPQPLQGRWFLIFIAIYLGIFLPVGFAKGLASSYLGLSKFFKLDHLKASSDWLKNNTAAGDIVFQTNWGTFPLLYYHNTHNYYLTGLDQTFMYEHDPVKYQLWLDATKGKRADIYDIAKYDFNAQWLLLEKKHPDSLRYLNREPRAQKVYQDDQAIIYKL